MIYFYYTALGVLALFETTSASPWLVAIALLLLVGMLRALYVRAAVPMTFAIPLIVPKFLFVFSLLFIAQGFLITELGVTASGPVRAGYYVLLSCAFFHVITLTFSGFRAILPPPVRLHQFLLFIIIAYAGAAGLTFLAVAYLLVTGLQSGFPLFEGIDRFAYRAQQDALFDIIMSNKPLLAAMLGILRFRLVNRAPAQWFLDALMMGFTVLTTLFGEKFLSVIILAVFYLIPYLVLRMDSLRLGPLLIFGAVLMTGVGSLTYYVYSGYGTLNYQQTSEKLFGRFTGQAQLWYAVMQEPTHAITVDTKQVQLMKNAMLSADANETAFQQRAGVFYLVLQYAPDEMAKSVFRQKGLVQFTGATEAWLILVLGHVLAIMILVFLAFLAGLLLLYLDGALRAGSLIGYLVGTFIFLPFYSMLNQGSFWQIFGWKALLYFAVGLSIDFLYRQISGHERQPRPLRSAYVITKEAEA